MILACSESARHTPVTAENGAVKFPLEEIKERVHFFTYKADNTNIDFLIRTDGSGNLHAHYDACYVCYMFKKGYRVEGEDLVCIECGFKFRIADEIWEEQRGCAPIDLQGKTEGDFFVIKAKDIERGKSLFESSPFS
jgi:uncharacterized membrane protein